MNIFDSLQSTMVATVTQTMGYQAWWIRTGNYNQGDFDSLDFNSDDFLTNTVPGKVLFRGPTQREKFFDAEYNADNLTMEFQVGIFDGLYAEGRKKSPLQEIIIEGIGIFNVMSMKKMHDGKTFQAQLQFKSS